MIEFLQTHKYIFGLPSQDCLKNDQSCRYRFSKNHFRSRCTGERFEIDGIWWFSLYTRWHSRGILSILRGQLKFKNVFKWRFFEFSTYRELFLCSSKYEGCRFFSLVRTSSSDSPSMRKHIQNEDSLKQLYFSSSIYAYKFHFTKLFLNSQWLYEQNLIGYCSTLET